MEKVVALKVDTKNKEFMFNLGILFAKGYKISIQNPEDVELAIKNEEKLGLTKSFNKMIKFWQDNNLSPSIYTGTFDKNGIFFICPVRNASQKERDVLNAYVSGFEKQGKNVHYPQRDTNQNPFASGINTGGYNICLQNAIAMAKCETIAIFYNKESVGSMFDLGVAYELIKNNSKLKFKVLNLKLELNTNDFIENKIVELFKLDRDRHPQLEDLFEQITNKI